MNHNEIILHIDYYGSLLTSHQLEILKMYYEDDLSMIEISEIKNISKSAVSDLIKRSTTQLFEYESKLKMIEQNQKIIKVLDQSKDDDLVKKIKKIIGG